VQEEPNRKWVKHFTRGQKRSLLRRYSDALQWAFDIKDEELEQEDER
jgi:hypothetical protein